MVGKRTVDGRFSPEGVSVSVYDGEGTVVAETWLTWDEIEDRKHNAESDFTFELGDPPSSPSRAGANPPDYLENLVKQAVEYYSEHDDVSVCGAAQEIAWQSDALYSRLRGQGRRNNLDILRDLRTLDTLCADELETYRRPNSDNPSAADWAEATIEAIVHRSLEEFLANELSDRLEDGQPVAG